MGARYAVFGQPIAHSLSPRIHAAFARALKLDIDYRAIESAPRNFAASLTRFAASGGAGANVTLPLKRDASSLCSTLSDRATRAGSVNTLSRSADGWFGDSTDGVGLLRDLRARHGIDPGGMRVLLLGAGGAACAIAPALLDSETPGLLLANRSFDRASELARRLGNRVRTTAWDDLDRLDPVDLLIDATSAGHASASLDLPAGLVAPHSVCYTLSYGRAAGSFSGWAHAAGAKQVIDGIGMLVEQAAESFVLWHGVKPDVDSVVAELRAHLDASAMPGGLGTSG
ncbi:MAG: shikimate dehydrogenase [Rhodanobacteraceae bacterium]